MNDATSPPLRWSPTDAQLTMALRHASANVPAETCGVIADGEFIAITNRATDHDAFVMDMPEYLAVTRSGKTIEAIVHSHHLLPPKASPADLSMCEATGKPWLIVSWPSCQHSVIEPCGYRAPLVGRAWAWGSHDCYGLIRDGIKEHAEIDIPDFHREWLWWEQGGDIIETQFEEAGFVKVDGPWQHCDVIGMKIRSPVVNHVGLFLAPDTILHQMMGRLSVREVYGGVYAMATTLHLRHRSRL